MYNDIVLQYDRGRTAADFVKYLNEKCGTHRQLGGLLSEEVRCLLSHTHFPSHTVTHTFTLVLTHPHTYHTQPMCELFHLHTHTHTHPPHRLE